MKKIIFILVALFSFVFSSCDKSTYTPEQNTVEVSFRFNIISGNILTKGFTDEILENLNYVYPEKLYLGSYTLDLKNNSTFSIQPGTYSVSSTYPVFFYNEDYLVPASNNSIPLVVERGFKLEITESGVFDINVVIPSIIIAAEKTQCSNLKWNSECQTHGENENLHMSDNYMYYILTIPKSLFVTSAAHQYITITLEENDTYEKMSQRLDINCNSIGKYYIFENTNLKNQKSPNMILSNSWTPGN